MSESGNNHMNAMNLRLNNQRTSALALATALTVVAGVSALSGCSNAGEGALSGAALGAGAGAIIGSFTGSAGVGAIIGGAAGALGGGVVGDQNRRNTENSRNYR